MNLLKNIEGSELLAYDELEDLEKRMMLHMKHVRNWRYGEPIKIFLNQDKPCIQYEDGNWWHYPGWGEWY